MKYLLIILLLITFSGIKAQPIITFQNIISGLTQPVDIVSQPGSGNRLFIVERGGNIKIWNGTSVLPAAFLNVAPIITTTNGEQGLLSLAFHPNYEGNGYFFIWYNNIEGAVTLARYTRSSLDSNLADGGSGVVLLSIAKRFTNHNGAKLIFGSDGYLYFGTGDGGSGGDPDNNAQNGASLLGKMLRIDVNNPNPPYYSIPPTNPFANSTAIRQEIISFGLRNPWRWSFDRQTGDMWIADVGQDAWEEVSYVPAANLLNRNYGWRCLEGTHVTPSPCTAEPNNVIPVFEYPHNNTAGGFSITGGYVYRGADFPQLQGFYLTTDFVSRNGWLIFPNGSGGWNSTMQTNWSAGLSSFGEGADGTLYATSLSGGIVYKVIASATLPVRLISFSAKENAGKHELSWKVANEESGDTYIVDKRTEQNGTFTEVHKTKATVSSINKDYKLQLPVNSITSIYRLRIIAVNGQTHFSNIISLNSKQLKQIKATVSGSNLTLNIPQRTEIVELYDGTGRKFKSIISPAVSSLNVPLNSLSKGVITIKAKIDDEWHVSRIVY